MPRMSSRSSRQPRDGCPYVRLWEAPMFKSLGGSAVKSRASRCRTICRVASLERLNLEIFGITGDLVYCSTFPGMGITRVFGIALVEYGWISEPVLFESRII